MATINTMTHWYEDTNDWKIYDLDVWGNQEEGYDINDFWEIARVSFTDKEISFDYMIVDKLIDMEILKPEARDLVYVDSDYGWISICDKDTDEPILGMEMIRIYHRREV